MSPRKNLHANDPLLSTHPSNAASVQQIVSQITIKFTLSGHFLTLSQPLDCFSLSLAFLKPVYIFGINSRRVGEPSRRFFQYFGIPLFRFSIYRAKRVELTGYRFCEKNRTGRTEPANQKRKLCLFSET